MVKKINSVAEYRRLDKEADRLWEGALSGIPENGRFHEIAELTYDYENEVFMKRHGRPIDRDNLSDIDLLSFIICDLMGLKEYTK